MRGDFASKKTIPKEKPNHGSKSAMLGYALKKPLLKERATAIKHNNCMRTRRWSNNSLNNEQF